MKSKSIFQLQKEATLINEANLTLAAVLEKLDDIGTSRRPLRSKSYVTGVTSLLEKLSKVAKFTDTTKDLSRTGGSFGVQLNNKVNVFFAKSALGEQVNIQIEGAQFEFYGKQFMNFGNKSTQSAIVKEVQNALTIDASSVT